MFRGKSPRKSVKFRPNSFLFNHRSHVDLSDRHFSGIPITKFFRHKVTNSGPPDSATPAGNASNSRQPWRHEMSSTISSLRYPPKCMAPAIPCFVSAALIRLQGQQSRRHLLRPQIQGTRHQCRIQRPIYVDWAFIIQIGTRYIHDVTS